MTLGGTAPDDRLGSNQVLPAHGPPLRGSVARRMSTVATINLSATGSRNAPNADVVPYMTTISCIT